MLRIRSALLFGALVLFSATSVTVVQAKAQTKKYTIYLSNNFIGNDWRQQMLRSARVSVQKPPLAGRVDLRIENVETTTQAQINSLNNIIRVHPDAIVLDAGSPTALNPTIERACKAGILIISFDQVVTADCAYKIESNWTTMTHDLATWVASAMGGKGKMLVDRGLPGAPISQMLESGYKEVLKKYPGIQVVGYFTGDYALGPEQTGVANLLAANPEVDGVLTQGYGVGAIKALQAAGRKLVPIAAFDYNVSAVTCAQTPGAQCILGANPAFLSSDAIRMAMNILDHKAAPPKLIKLETLRLVTNFVPGNYTPGAKFEKIVIGTNAFPNQPPGLTLPVTPDWVNMTVQDVAGK
jgi:ribose transport system substrate-binding protein